MSKENKEEGEAFKVHDRRFSNRDDDESLENPAEGASQEGPQTLSFQAETKQLLDLMVHSLYSNKEIFLRELLSNASDAIDRLRFEALTRPDLVGDDTFEIRLKADAEARTLTIADNGVGMSRQEVIANIGTIAKSGTKELLNRLKGSGSDDQTLSLIGQFGVGFYSAFMVADRITLTTRRAGEHTTTLWESTGDGTFSIRDTGITERGTSITLHLKPADAEDGLDDFTSEWVLGRIVKKYSDFVQVPIILQTTREDVETDDEGNPKDSGATKTVVEDKTLNSMKAIWKRRPQEISKEEYAEFYKHIAHAWDEPLKTLTLSAEGRLEYQALLFIPSKAPFDLFHQGAETGLQLYVNNVKILDHCEDLLPRYLRFIRGVVDSADLPLNVSRELLQNNRQIGLIRKGLVKKTLDTLADLQKEDSETYLAFWREFGRLLKEGVGGDTDNKDKLLPLLLVESSADAEKLTTLAQYVERMKDDQDEIYYLTGESREAVEKSPHLEAFTAKGYEVLYLTDPVDELVTQSLTEFDEKKLKSVGKGTVELGSKEERDQAEKDRKEKQEGVAGLLELMQKKLDEHVKEVRLSNRLTSSPVCLVGGENDLSPQLERMLQQAQGSAPQQKRIMELNADHAVFEQMKARFDNDHDDPILTDYAQLLLGQGLLAEGSALPDPPAFARLVAEVMVRCDASPQQSSG